MTPTGHKHVTLPTDPAHRRIIDALIGFQYDEGPAGPAWSLLCDFDNLEPGCEWADAFWRDAAAHVACGGSW